MDEIKLSSWEPSPTGLSLFSQKKKALLLVVVVSVVTMAPLIVKNLIEGYYWLALSLTVFVSLLLIDTFYVLRKKPALIHHAVIAAALTIALLLSEYRLGVIGLFWIFPAVTALIFVLPSKVAYFFNTLIMVSSASLAYIEFGATVASRFAVSLLFTMIIVTVLLNVIKSLVEQLTDQSIKDPLTGAFNRRQLSFYLDDCLQQARIFGVESAIVLFDIDHFKAINDELGHVNGDQLIQYASNTIATRAKSSDLLFRIGGDEFLLLAPATNSKQALERAENIRIAIAKKRHANGVKLSVSAGVATIDQSDNAETWVAHADEALMQAKRNGKDRAESYSS